MIPVEAHVLRKGDRFKINENSRREYTVTGSCLSSDDGEIVILALRERPELVLPLRTEMVAVSMYRIVKVPCLAARHGDEPVTMMYDMASGAVPRAVICGSCDEEVTAEVVARMQAGQVADEPAKGTANVLCLCGDMQAHHVMNRLECCIDDCDCKAYRTNPGGAGSQQPKEGQ